MRREANSRIIPYSESASAMVGRVRAKIPWNSVSGAVSSGRSQECPACKKNVGKRPEKKNP